MCNIYLETLLEFPLFLGINADELPLTLSCLNAKTIEYKKGEYVAIAGDEFIGVGLVLTGEVAIIKENSVGNRNIIAVFKKCDMFGEVMAFADSKTWPVNVITQTDSVIMFIHPQKIIGVCNKACVNHKLLISNMIKIISRKTLLLNKKMEYLTIKSMKGKISKYLFDEYKKSGNISTFNIPLSREKLADFLNVSRPSMSRELCKMRDDGVIEFYKNSIRILNLDKLKSMLE
jgi:CRP-like cAMP-binding protein